MNTRLLLCAYTELGLGNIVVTVVLWGCACQCVCSLLLCALISCLIGIAERKWFQIWLHRNDILLVWESATKWMWPFMIVICFNKEVKVGPWMHCQLSGVPLSGMSNIYKILYLNHLIGIKHSHICGCAKWYPNFSKPKFEWLLRGF